MLAPVYAKYNHKITKSQGNYIFTDDGQRILDFYSGHGVISLGHQHPQFVSDLKKQMDEIIYYSNAVHMPIQEQLATTIEAVSSVSDVQLFLCNSGAEAVENALKVAAFHNQRHKVVALKNSFHGRTSLAVQCTDNPRLRTTLNQGTKVEFVAINSFEEASKSIDDETCAVIVEGIQGIGGIHQPSSEFWSLLRELCDQKGALLIADEIQSGFARSGKFFAYQHGLAIPDIITMAKGMGNGFPVGGILVQNKFKLKTGDLGTTFGGNPLACRAALSVCEIIKSEGLMANASQQGEFLMNHLQDMPGIKEVRGQGLMIGFDLHLDSAAPVRKQLLEKHQIICGSAKSPETIRLLPPLGVTKNECGQFLEAIESTLKEHI